MIKHKHLLIILGLLIASSGYGQKNQKVDLTWKIGEGETILYKTSLSKAEKSQFEGLNIDTFFGFLPDSVKSKSGKFFKEMMDAFGEADLYCALRKMNDDNISVVMVNEPKEQINTEQDSLEVFMEMFKKFNQGVVLRGAVKPSGEIASFYLKPDQKNLLSMMFELPSMPVKVGDSWELNVSLLMFDHNFVCEKSERRNTVTLERIENVATDSVAILNYDIYESVSGVFNNPFMNTKTSTEMTISFQGYAEFSITKGYWLSFNCVSMTEASGVMNANFVQKNHLELLDQIPPSIQKVLNSE